MVFGEDLLDEKSSDADDEECFYGVIYTLGWVRQDVSVPAPVPLCGSCTMPLSFSSSPMFCNADAQAFNKAIVLQPCLMVCVRNISCADK